ncbi:hypothetical protein JKP88DRAFT_24992 [Tribonema minus]|uniref:Uncharacterized protein n=1 Tax=Tribonema minus TaxID=303371 RepID=A0A835ZAW2_9STRA|nr:hypothetical protein JKP88DRAFT_24992 [Tribonema minus]
MCIVRCTVERCCLACLACHMFQTTFESILLVLAWLRSNTCRFSVPVPRPVAAAYSLASALIFLPPLFTNCKVAPTNHQGPPLLRCAVATCSNVC